MQYSIQDVRGFTIVAGDAACGHIHDMLFDDESHVIPFMVVEIRRFWRSTRVLLPAGRIRGICRSLIRVLTEMDKKAVRSLPRYAPIH